MSPHDALRQDQVDDEEKHHTRVGKYGGHNDEAGVVVVDSPGNAQHVGHDASHGESEQNGREYEFVIAAEVELKYRHPEGRGENKEDD